MSRTYGVPVLLAVLIVAGCASRRSGDVYSRGQAMRSQTVQYGIVESVRTVQIEGTRSGLGAVAGGVAGGVAGSTVGGGKGSILAALGGAALGAVGGAVAEEKLTEKGGLEITVKLDSGVLVAIVQEADILFSPGERVRVLTGPDGSSRVVR